MDSTRLIRNTSRGCGMVLKTKDTERVLPQNEAVSADGIKKTSSKFENIKTSS